MTTIKIKIKHFILIIVLVPMLLFILPYGYLFCADKISKNKPEAATIMYKNYLNTPSFIIHKDHAMFSLALKSFPIEGSSYYQKIYTNGSSMNASYISKEMLDTAISLYKNILENYKNSPIYEKSYNNLLFLYTYSANVNAAEKLISSGEVSNRKSIRITAAKYRMYYKLAQKQYSEVLSLGHKFLKEYMYDSDLNKLMAEASLLSKDFDAASNYFNKSGNSGFYKNDDTLYSLFQSNSSIEQASAVKLLKANSSKNTDVKGRVTILGKGVPFARVYLKKLSDNGIYSGEERELSFGITDFNGNYTIKDAPLGSYSLMLSIPGFLLNATALSENSNSAFTLSKQSTITYDFKFVQPMKLSIGNKSKVNKDYVKLSWEPVHKAAYYTIHAILLNNPKKPDGNSSWIQISNEINTESYTLDLNAVNAKPTGFSISDEGKVNPQAYLGAFYPGCSVPIYINAYDTNGLLLTSSMSRIVLYDNLPIIRLSTKGLTQGEKLILQGNPEKAQKLLKQELVKNPDNIRIMTTLSNLYTIGTKVNVKSRNKTIGQDLDYALTLNSRLYELTKNLEYIRKNSYIYQYELKDYKGLLKNYTNFPSSKLTSQDYDTLAETNLLLGKFKEAEQNFNKMYKALKLAPSTNLNPILLSIYNKDFHAAASAIKRTDLRLYKVSTAQLHNDIIAVSLSKPSTQEYTTFKRVIRMILTRTLHTREAIEYRGLIKQIENPHLTSLITQALDYHSIY